MPRGLPGPGRPRPDAPSRVTSWSETLVGLQAEQIAIEPEDAVRAGSLDWPHRDPFDRMIVAQARRRHLVVATGDDALLVPVLDIRRVGRR